MSKITSRKLSYFTAFTIVLILLCSFQSAYSPVLVNDKLIEDSKYPPKLTDEMKEAFHKQVEADKEKVLHDILADMESPDEPLREDDYDYYLDWYGVCNVYGETASCTNPGAIIYPSDTYCANVTVLYDGDSVEIIAMTLGNFWGGIKVRMAYNTGCVKWGNYVTVYTSDNGFEWYYCGGNDAVSDQLQPIYIGEAYGYSSIYCGLYIWAWEAYGLNASVRIDSVSFEYGY